MAGLGKMARGGKSFTVEILEDGRIRIDMDDMSGPMHMACEEFLSWLEEDCGMKAEVEHKHGKHAHAHAHAHHGHMHRHKHTH